MKTLLTNVILSAVPVMAVLAALIYKNRNNALTPREILVSMMAGLFVIFPASMVEFTISIYTSRVPGFLKLLIHAFIIAALVEETTKFLVVRLIYYIKNVKIFDNAMTMAVAAGIGFAFLENIMYSFDSSFIVMVRSVTAVPLHVITTGITGYYLFKRVPERHYSHMRGFAEAFVIHGVYDLLISLKSGFSFLALPLLVWAGFRLYKLYKTGIRE